MTAPLAVKSYAPHVWCWEHGGGVSIDALVISGVQETLSTHETGGPQNKHPENRLPNLPEGGSIRPANKAKELE